MKIRVGIVGFGNMGAAIGLALKKSNRYEVSAFETDPQKRKGTRFLTSCRSLIASNSVVILAIKPQDIPQLLRENKEHFTTFRPLVITIAAGLPCAFFEKHLAESRVVRVMPNLPAKINESVSFIAKGKYASKTDMATAQKIFSCVGTVFVTPENMLDKVTAVCGSGPGFVFYLMDCFYAAALKLGFTSLSTREIIARVFYGSAKLALTEDVDFKLLTTRVTSKGGTTRAGLDVLETGKLAALIEKTFYAAADRAKELSGKENSWNASA